MYALIETRQKKETQSLILFPFPSQVYIQTFIAEQIQKRKVKSKKKSPHPKPPNCAASLRLCNHKLHVVQGKRSFRDLYQSDPYLNEQALLLQALDRDLPRTLYCFTCNTLHVLFRGHEDRLGAEEIYRRVSDRRCPSSDGTYNYGTTYTYHAGFNFEHVQMAMKSYRRDFLSDAKAFLEASVFLQPTRGRMTYLPANMGLLFFEPRFVNDQIAVRAQSWILIRGDTEPRNTGERQQMSSIQTDGVIPETFTPNAYIAFLQGLKGCMGKKNAETEMKAILCCLLSAYRFEMDDTVDDPENWKMWRVVLRPKDGISLKVTPLA